MCIGSLEKQQGQCTELPIAGLCTGHKPLLCMEVSLAVLVFPSTLGTLVGLELTDCALLKEVLDKDGQVR